MKEKSDTSLVREYAQNGSDSAFGEIVARYTDLVYSAALRQVGSPDSAMDVAQKVFTDLARKARSLAGRMNADASLVGWLYRATRYAALTFIRNEQRRQAREREAMRYLASSQVSPHWDQLGPLLDEAMANLNDTDRDALLLRFFKNQDFRAVGAALGVSDDTAQKRVMRGLEKLRAALSGRGIKMTAAALSTTIGLNAVQAAPSGLAATLTSASLAAGTSTTLTLLEVMAMTKSQLSIIGTVIIASVVTPLVIQHQAQARLGAQDAVLQQQSVDVADLRAANQRLAAMLGNAQPSPAASNGELLKLRGQVARLHKDVQELSQSKTVTPKSRAEMLASLSQRYSQRVTELKMLLDANPSEKIPELQFVTDSDWLFVVNRVTEGEDGYRRAMSLARQVGEQNFVNNTLHQALQRFGEENSGKFPSHLEQLKPYFKTAVDDVVLQRWAIWPKNKLTKDLTHHLGADENWLITQKAPVNVMMDQRIVLGIKQLNAFSAAPPEQWTLVP